MQALVVITVTGHPHTWQARLDGPTRGTPQPGALAQHSAPEFSFSPPLTVLPWHWPQISRTTFDKSPSMGLPWFCRQSYNLYHRRWLAGRGMHVNPHTRTHAHLHLLKHMWSPTELLGASHPRPHLTSSPSSPTTKATGNSSPWLHSRQCKTQRQASLPGCFKLLAGCEPRWLTVRLARDSPSLSSPLPQPLVQRTWKGLAGRLWHSAWYQGAKDLDC